MASGSGSDWFKAERVLLVRQQAFRSAISEDFAEIQGLAVAAGSEVVCHISAVRKIPHPATFLGSGKVLEITELVKKLAVDVVILDHNATPVQERNLEKAFHCRVIDRTRLILDIFALRARTSEGKRQVELAQLNHLATRLVRGWTHLERQRGGLGLRGPGETQLETDRRLIGRRIKTLDRKLDKVRLQRALRRNHRDRVPIPTVAIVGYTNAGKSTLFKCLTGSDVFIQDQLFATLDTTVRRVNLSDSHSCLLSDTVGFIRKLPHHLVASFRSTLKEVLDADLLLIVLDMSSPFMKDHLATIQSVLKDLDADKLPQMLVLNKADLISDAEKINESIHLFPDSVTVSAQEYLRIDQLKENILEIMDKNFQTIEIEVSYEKGKLISDAQEGVEVLNREYLDTGVKLTIRGNRSRIEQIQSAALN